MKKRLIYTYAISTPHRNGKCDWGVIGSMQFNGNGSRMWLLCLNSLHVPTKFNYRIDSLKIKALLININRLTVKRKCDDSYHHNQSVFFSLVIRSSGKPFLLIPGICVTQFRFPNHKRCTKRRPFVQAIQQYPLSLFRLHQSIDHVSNHHNSLIGLLYELFQLFYKTD